MRTRLFVLRSLVFGLLVCGFAHTARAQSGTNQLSPFKNYFVTGDYVVGGVGLRGLGDPATNLATGTISIPDTVQAQATGVPSPSVPAGADIVAAFLYWATVEKSKSAFDGQKGFFNGYAIIGAVLGNQNSPTSWSSGGCSGNNNGTTTIRAYRADVRPFLPVDANGKVQGNGSYQVKLADSGSNGGGTPLTLGASLVIIYRVQSPLVPLNSIVLYDGAFAPSNQSSNSEMTQTIQGFYQAAANPVAKLTHIVGDGQPNKSEQVFLQNIALPFLYPANPNVAFPGIYNGSWDNPTWPVNTAVQANDASETTSVVPSSSGSGCVDWGAVIFSTTVQDTDGDGLLDVWEDSQGYTDAISGQFVALPAANKSVKDIFAEIDYLNNLDGLAGSYLHSHLPKQRALDMVGDAFARQNINAHFDVGTNYNGANVCKLTPPAVANQQVCPDPYIVQGGTGGNSISESVVLCSDSAAMLCPFPGTPAVGWKEGFLFVKNNATVPNSNPPIPLGNFQFGRKDSYHYVLFGHALGIPRTFWSTFGAAMQGATFAKLVSIVNSGTAAVVTIQTPQGLFKPGDCPNAGIPECSDANVDRVTVAGAIGQPALNGTYHFTNLSSSVDANNVTTTTFNIATTNTTTTCTVAPCVADGTYNLSNEPRLAVDYGGPTSTSGHSDVGGGDSAVTFGLWFADDAAGCQADPSVGLAPGQMYCVNEVGTITAEGGTLLHEAGHTLFLTHAGTFFPNGEVMSGPFAGQYLNSPPALPNYGLNCNAAFLSSMNYLFQIRGFPDGGIDYSGQTLPSLSELALDETLGIGSDMFTSSNAAHFTRWFAPPNALDAQLQNTTGGRFATRHCDGTPIGPNEPPAVRVDGSTFSAPIDWNNNLIVPDLTEPVAWQDVNLNGSTISSPDPPSPPAFNNMQGFNDWVNVDLRQMGSRENALGFSSGALPLSGGGGTPLLSGGGGTPALSGGGGVPPLSGGGGTPALSGGGGVIGLSGGGGNEQDVDAACSTADPPTGLTAVLSGHNVVLNWTAPGLCQVQRYSIWRAKGSFPTLASALANLSLFTNIKNIARQNGPPPTTFTDTNVKNNNTYTYFVTDTNVEGAQSGPSNPPTTIFVKF